MQNYDISLSLYIRLLSSGAQWKHNTYKYFDALGGGGGLNSRMGRARLALLRLTTLTITPPRHHQKECSSDTYNAVRRRSSLRIGVLYLYFCVHNYDISLSQYRLLSLDRFIALFFFNCTMDKCLVFASG